MRPASSKSRALNAFASSSSPSITRLVTRSTSEMDVEMGPRAPPRGDPPDDLKAVAALDAASSTSGCITLVLEWSDEAAYSIKQEHLDTEAPDLLIACDCIFQPLFGSAFLLLQMIQALAGPETIVILALERRKDDGAEAFFEQAAAAGFATELRLRRERVLVCEMRRT